MAAFTVSGIENLSFDVFLELEDTAEEMLLAEAEIVEAKQKSVGKSMGVYDENSNIHVINKITHGKLIKADDEYRIFVYPQGKRTRYNTTSTNSEIAFMNEYGKAGQPARPWITTANAQAEESALDAAEKIFDTWLKENDT